MTKSEAEELLIAAIFSNEDTVAIEISLAETQVFRVLVGRILKEMEKKNRALWLKARDYGIEYKQNEASTTGGFALIKKLSARRHTLYKVSEAGELTELNKETIVEQSNEKTEEQD